MRIQVAGHLQGLGYRILSSPVMKIDFEIHGDSWQPVFRWWRGIWKISAFPFCAAALQSVRFLSGKRFGTWKKCLQEKDMVMTIINVIASDYIAYPLHSAYPLRSCFKFASSFLKTLMIICLIQFVKHLSARGCFIGMMLKSISLVCNTSLHSKISLKIVCFMTITLRANHTGITAFLPMHLQPG